MINIIFDQILGDLSSYFATCQIVVETPSSGCVSRRFSDSKRSFLYLQIHENKSSYITLVTIVLLFYAEARKNSFYSQKSVRIFFFLLRGGLISGSGDFWGDSTDFFSGS